MHIQLARLGALLSVLLLAFPAQAVTFWEDNFENHLNAGGKGPWDTSQCVAWWGIPAPAADGCTKYNNPAVTTRAFARSGTHVFEANFNGPKVADGGDGTHGARIWRNHPITTDHWMRVWYRRSADYVPNTVGNKVTKVFYLKPPADSGPAPFWAQTTNGKFYMGMQNGGSVFCVTANRMDAACNYYNNLANPGFAADTWYCLEFHVNLGTVGKANGALESWVNGVKTMEHLNVALSGSTPGLTSTGWFVQASDSGARYIDDLAVGNTRIGCGKPLPPPPPPQNLTVQ